MSTRSFRRPPRLVPPGVPIGELTLRAPPELPGADGGNGWLTALPALGGLGSVAYMFAGPASPVTYVAGSMFLASSLAMVGGGLLRGRSTGRTSAAQVRREYAAHLTAVRAAAQEATRAQRDAASWTHPDPRWLHSVVTGPRLWERRADDADFLVLRVGVGLAPLCTPLVSGPTAAFADLDPAGLAAYTRFRATHESVAAMPVTLDLRRTSVVRVTGHGRRDLARAMIAQTVALHAPGDVRVAVCTAQPDLGEWSWAKWLPHAQHPTVLDRAGPVRLLVPSLGALERLRPVDADGHWVVVLDGGRSDDSPLLTDPDGVAGLTVVDLDGHLPAGVTIDAGRDLRVLAAGGAAGAGTPDRLGVVEAEALARTLAGVRPHRSTGHPEEADEGHRTLTDLLGITDAGTLDLDGLRRPRGRWDRLRVPIGTTGTGGPLLLDLKESAERGAGPHGLLVGATGSGKSELLRTLVLALLTTHDSASLNAVLVDFKGGATFAGLAVLPHVSALITNLHDDLAQVDRMRDALAGELHRRQQALRDAGDLASVRDYELARTAGAPLPPLPTLLVVVDEFSELLVHRPELVELFGQIGRLGRSLGLHLLLATQRLEEGRLRGLEAHLSYRIALRTFSAAESRTVLGVPDAHHLPTEPGHGYLLTDTAAPVRFRAAYVSAPYDDAPAGADVTGPVVVRPFIAAYQPFGPDRSAAEETPAPPGPTVLSVVAAQLSQVGPPAHRVWLPPLAGPLPLAALQAGLAVRPGRGYGADPDLPSFRVAVGQIDRPFHQRRDPLVVDLTGAGGHVAVVGGPRSGKSTLLRTVVTSLALRHTPDELQVYGLDLAGGGLVGLADLPHVGGLAGRQDPDAVRRTLAHVRRLIEDRERDIRLLGVDSLAAYRASGRTLPEVVLVVDGLGVLRQEFDDVEATLVAWAGRALTYGVHLLLGASRWTEVRLGLRDLIGTKLELKLADPLDSDVDRRTAADVPSGRPGRGVTTEREHFLGANADPSLVAQIAAAWVGAPAELVRTLPDELPLAALGPDLPPPGGVVVGWEGIRLGPVVLGDRTDPGLVVVGDAGSGRTSFLRAIAAQVERRPSSAAKLVVVDYRRELADSVPPEHLLGRAGHPAETSEVVAGLVTGLTRRLPGPHTTAAQIRDRSWWSGPEIFVLVDDYDLVAGSVNPLLPLTDFLPQARDIGLHLLVTCRAGGAGRLLLDPLLGRCRELGFPAVVLSAPADEGPMYGVRPRSLPPGRGTVVHRRHGAAPVQLLRA